ncbi:hypothetical protein SUDANB178_01182 [Streptomyces sp. enrichment culture]
MQYGTDDVPRPYGERARQYGVWAHAPMYPIRRAICLITRRDAVRMR